MTAEKRHCESAVADAAVSSYIAHERNKFLRRSVSDEAISAKRSKKNILRHDILDSIDLRTKIKD
jgi:hypothetical protein